MQVRTNSVVVIAALLAIGWPKSPINPVRAASTLKLVSGYPFTESGSALIGYRVGLKAQRSRVTVARAQDVPRLPAGATGAIAGPTDNYFRYHDIPVVTHSPFTRHQIDPAQIKRTTQQLASLLKTVQPEVGEVSKGKLPKGLIPNLKRIEKLSKQLRREIS